MAPSIFGRQGSVAAPRPTPKQSGNDPRGQSQNMIQHQQERYENQQGPLANQFAMMTGRANEANYGDYTDIMNRYRDIAGGGGESGGGGGGGGGGGYSAFTVSPGKASYVDPFKSYTGYEEFSKTGGYTPNNEAYAGYSKFGKTGGYSAQDMQNLRSRGMSPIRAAYGNAEREMGRSRSLQGGYSPNMVAAQARMAREQGQGMADALQNVEAGIVADRNKGMLSGYEGMAGIDKNRIANQLSGYGGMSDIEGQRLGADVDLSKFNVGLDFEGQKYNASAQSQAQAANNAAAENAAAASRSDQFRALSGMTSLYGATPGMSELFGNQAINTMNSGGNFGLGLAQEQRLGQQLPGQFDQTTGRIRDVGDIAGRVANPIIDYYEQRRRQQQAPTRTTNYQQNIDESA